MIRNGYLTGLSWMENWKFDGWKLISNYLRLHFWEFHCKMFFVADKRTSRGGAVVARRAHNPKVAGSNPVPATIGPLA